MSAPIRYTGKTENSVIGSPHWEHPEGEWVKFEDYARLKAEVERLTKENALATPRHLIASQDITSLREQVERLTKAGDNLERVLVSRCGSYEAGNASHEWQSAKNYKPSV
jgi:hypothetical protein